MLSMKFLKNEHDKLIFGIVNGYNIRHNRADQRTIIAKKYGMIG